MSYPKFKNGEATVRDVKITQNFGRFYFGMYKKTVCSNRHPGNGNQSICYAILQIMLWKFTRYF